MCVCVSVYFHGIPFNCFLLSVFSCCIYVKIYIQGRGVDQDWDPKRPNEEKKKNPHREWAVLTVLMAGSGGQI